MTGGGKESKKMNVFLFFLNVEAPPTLVPFPSTHRFPLFRR